MDEFYEKLRKIASRMAMSTEHRSSVAVELHPDGSGVILHLTYKEDSDEIGTTLRLCQFTNSKEFAEAVDDFEAGLFFRQIVA